MTQQIAFLRGINVSGHRLIKMTELKQMFETMGFHSVQTYIQSGNVLFQADEEEGSLRGRIEEGIVTTFGFPVTVVVRTMAEVKRMIEECPFAIEPVPDKKRLYVALLEDYPAQEGINRLGVNSGGIDEYRLIGRSVYILYGQSAHQSPLTNNFFEKKLGVAATSRNWTTMNKLLDMGKAIH